MSNFSTKALIQIEGVETNSAILYVVDNGSFVVDEVILGQNSGASAVCVGFGDDGTQYIILKDRDGFFDQIEPIVGNIAGSDTTINGTSFKSIPYTNNDLGIVAGLWNIYTTGDLLASIDDSVRKIDISKGGNYATGYTFGFTLANFELVIDIISDGVFLKNLPIRYFIDFGNGYEGVWTGIIDTIPTTGSVTAKFTCIDSMKSKKEKIGSEKVPIALNQNYNCKLPLADDGESETIYKYPTIDGTSTTNYYYCYGPNKTWNVNNIIDTPEELQIVLFVIKDGSEWKTALDSGEQLALKAVAGLASGSNFNISKVQNKGPAIAGSSYYELTVDEITTPISGDIVAIGPTTIFNLVKYENTYNLSQNDVYNVHESNGTYERTLRSIDVSGSENSTEKIVESFLTKGENFDNTQKQVYVFGIDEDNKIIAKDSRQIDTSGAFISSQTFDDTSIAFTLVTANVRIPMLDLIQTNSLNDDLFIRMKSVTFNSTFDAGTGYVDPNEACTIVAFGSYRPEIISTGITNNSFLSSSVTLSDGVKSGSDITFQFIIPDEFLQFQDFGDYEVYSSAYIEMNFIFAIQGSSFTGTPILTGVSFDDVKYQTISKIDLGKLSIGCNGENLTSGNFVGYPETIKYIQTAYAGVDLSEINQSSYTQAETDYNIFPSYTDRNPAHQITDQSDYLSIISKMLYFSHLGLFIDRYGSLTLSNWLPKSTVFSDTTPSSSYTETEYTNISDISRPRTIQVISDFQLKYDYSEALGEYLSVVRIKDTDSSSFVLSTDTVDGNTEGVSQQFAKEAEQAYELLRAGYNRTKKLSQFELDSKWIKRFLNNNSFIGGESEAINFIRNQAGHINREHERVTITLQLNETDAIKELLSFDSIYHKKKTNDEVRKGWLVESRISWRSKTIKFTYLLDISLKDPFLYRIGIIQDNATVDDIIENDETSTDIIEDGGGI